MNIAEHISPSLICTDLCNIERDVKALEAGGIRMLHVDIFVAGTACLFKAGRTLRENIKQLTEDVRAL